MKALLYLNVHLFKNSVATTIRNPRQILPALFFVFIFAVPSIVFYTQNVPLTAFSFTSQTVKPIIFSFLIFITWMTVIYSVTGNALVFKLSEIDFLFPSPLGRKTILLNRIVINYVKMASQYLVITAFLLFVFSSIYKFSFWPRILFLWLAIFLAMVFAFNLGSLISLLGSHFSELRRSRSRRIVIFASAIFLGTLLGYAYWYTLEGIPFIEAVIKVLNSSFVRILLYPMAAASDVGVAWRLTADVGLKILFLAALCLITTGGVLSIEAHFYEASEATSREMWKSVQKLKRQEVLVSESFIKRMRKISPFGRGSTALVWKNLVGMLRDIRNLVPAIFMAVFLFVIMLVQGDGYEFSRAVFFLFFLVFVATGYVRWDFRQDLRRIEIIKLIPDSNFRIVLSEIAVPVIFSIIISYFFLVISILIFPDTGSKALLAGFSVIALPIFSVITATISNLFVLYYPPQTNNQIIPGILSLIFIALVAGSSVVLGMISSNLGKMGIGLLLILCLNMVVASIVLKLLSRKFGLFDLTSS